jgi:phospho-N-acetylmuramoyl-pentapeptide-transferase
VARPDPTVPNHTKDVPLLGGVGMVGCAMIAEATSGFGKSSGIELLAASAVMFGLGAFKDRVGRNVAPIRQLVAQCASVCLAYAGAGGTIGNGTWPVYALVAVVAGLALVNAVNFLDVMDGLSGGTCLLSAIGFAVVLNGDDEPAGRLATALAGGIAGFLVLNAHPARIFMGDIGSFGIGVVLFMLAVRTAALHGLWTALAVVAVPAAELVITLALRLTSGASPFEGDGNHASLGLLRKGWPVWRIVFLFWGVQAAFVAVALSSI